MIHIIVYKINSWNLFKLHVCGFLDPGFIKYCIFLTNKIKSHWAHSCFPDHTGFLFCSLTCSLYQTAMTAKISIWPFVTLNLFLCRTFSSSCFYEQVWTDVLRSSLQLQFLLLLSSLYFQSSISPRLISHPAIMLFAIDQLVV